MQTATYAIVKPYAGSRKAARCGRWNKTKYTTVQEWSEAMKREHGDVVYWIRWCDCSWTTIANLKHRAELYRLKGTDTYFAMRLEA
jgi:hypothetical protein